MRRQRTFGFVVWALGVVAVSAWGQVGQVVQGGQGGGAGTEGPAASQPVSLKAQITAEREKLAGELKSAKAALEAVTKEGQAAPETLTEEIERLNRLDLQLGQILAGLEHEEELKASLGQLQTDLDNLRSRGPAEQRPFSFLLLETLRDQLETEKGRADSLAAGEDSAQAALASAKAALEEAERARRQAREAAEKEKAAGLMAALRLRQLESRVAGAELRFRELETANQKLAAEAHEKRLTFLEEKIEQISGDVQFREEDLTGSLAKIDEQKVRINQASDWAKVDLNALDSQWMEARRRLEASSERDPVLVEEVEARRLSRQGRQKEMTLLGEQLQALADAEKTWKRRYQIFNEALPKKTLAEWESETRTVVESLERDIQSKTALLGDLRKEAITVEGRIAATEEGQGNLRRWLNEQKSQLAKSIRVYEGTLDRLETVRRLHQKLLNEAGTQIQQVSWGERFANAWEVVRSIWNYELTSVQDNPITVRKVVIGIILLLLGIYVSRYLSGVVGGRFLPRFGLDESVAAAIQSLLFYLLVLTVAMFSLKIVNVPLTAFTILGGALAIGIGFGSQNIMNNFISGLILLAERSIRVGDLIEIEDLIGKIEHIGPRSTRVRAPQNMDIIVPNSSFLEKNVTNWTLFDDRYRAHVTVGIVYGSPTRDATKLIRKALDEHGKVLPKPEPIILFAEFGDNALIFEAHFWVRMRRIMDRRIIESDIRFRIDALFREANIVIAFPQRDVHLYNQKPLDVRVLREAEDGPADVDSDPVEVSGD